MGGWSWLTSSASGAPLFLGLGSAPRASADTPETGRCCRSKLPLSPLPPPHPSGLLDIHQHTLDRPFPEKFTAGTW